MSRRGITRSEYILKRILIILGCILAVIVILAASVKIMTILGRSRLDKNANTTGPEIAEEEDSQMRKDPAYSTDWQEGWVSLDGRVYEYNDEIRTFLIMGIDDAHGQSDDKEVLEKTSGGQADGLFLVIINPVDESIKIMAVNRNTEVPITLANMGQDDSDAGIYDGPIAVQHAFGGGAEYSCELTRDAVSKLLFNMPIHAYMSVSYEAIPKINDAVGGVTLTIPEGMDDLLKVNSKWTAGSTITLKGQDAVDFVRKRDTEEFESARKRLSRQKLYLTRLIKQMKEETKKDITLPVSMYSKLKEYIVTDLTVDEMSYLVSDYAGYSFDGEDIYTMEGETVLKDDGFEHFYPDEEALRAMVIQLFYKEVDRKDAKQ
ncbi:MAG: LCP family protein [Lachnospiraceae bacterium]|nr:LCP family protein [Lachnospiraceae bacterium]